MHFSANHKNFANCVKIKEFQIEDPFTAKKLPFTTLIEELKPIVKEKSEFEHRIKLKLISFFKPFWTIRILTQKSRSIIFLSISSPQVERCGLNTWKNSSS